jgi:aerobic-type carbon monoxide dehydrogenase small subunit (CoxS/CutS family)
MKKINKQEEVKVLNCYETNLNNLKSMLEKLPADTDKEIKEAIEANIKKEEKNVADYQAGLIELPFTKEE